MTYQRERMPLYSRGILFFLLLHCLKKSCN